MVVQKGCILVVRARRAQGYRSLLKTHPATQFSQQSNIVGMTRHMSDNCTSNRFSEQVEVTHNIEDLVARQLVGKTQIRINDFLVIDEDAVVELATVYQARLL